MPRRADKKSESPRRKAPKPAAAGKRVSAPATQSKTTKKKVASAKPSSGARGVVKRVVATVVGALSRRRKPAENPVSTRNTEKGPVKAARVARRQPDIPMDQIAATYTPTQTSIKGPFRATGADHSSDQEFATGTGNGRWNDEDRLTNKSGDPRIGTHGRTYEPGEKRAAKNKDQDE